MKQITVWMPDGRVEMYAVTTITTIKYKKIIHNLLLLFEYCYCAVIMAISS